MNKKIHIIWASLCAILLTLLIVTLHLYHKSEIHATNLQQQLASLNEKVKKSDVLKHISTQMEYIAYQQKDISDKRSNEAVQQSKIANEMRSRAEVMRGRADMEKLKAESSEKKAVASYNAAREQRALAEEKQRQAEYAKRIADTLSYKALARSLGAQSTTQYQIGNKDLASLLAYSSWSFASRYHEDVYLPAIYNALSLSSQSVSIKNDNKGGITKIIFANSHSSFVTISKYGEIIQWDDVQGKMLPTPLLRDSKCDFRDVITEAGTLYALSRNGELYVKSNVGASTYPLEGSNFMKICRIDKQTLMMAAEKELCFYNRDGMRLTRTIALPGKLSTIGKQGSQYIIFCQNGSSYLLTDEYTLRPLSLNTGSPVTAYSWSPTLQLSALGTQNGKIYLLNKSWQTMKTLTGHRSAITQVGYSDDNLLSSSYDCAINMWNLKLQKVEPVTLKTFSSWVLCFNASEKGMIWTGDESGNLARIVVSPNAMANKIKGSMKRNFTIDEWNYYVGSSVPFESYTTH